MFFYEKNHVFYDFLLKKLAFLKKKLYLCTAKKYKLQKNVITMWYCRTA